MESHGSKKRWLFVFIVSIAVLVALVIFRSRRPGEEAGAGRVLRIVSLAPNVTEIIYKLGLQEQLVGATDYCDYPPEAKQIERVAGFGDPNIEKLFSLKPDLILGTELEEKDLQQVMEGEGARVLLTPIDSFESLFAAFHKIAEAVHRPDAAERVVAHMKKELRETASRFKDVPEGQRPRLYIEVWHDPVRTAGSKSFLNEVVTRAGGVNVAAELDSAHPAVNPEKVIEWDPDVILICYMTPGVNLAEQVAGRIGWKKIKAVSNGRVISDINPDMVLRPGPRLAQAVKEISERLYPASGIPK